MMTCAQVQVLYIPPSEYSTPASPPRSSSSGLAAELSESRGSAAAAAASVVPYSSLRGAGIPCACVKVSKTQQQLPVIDHHHHSSPFRAMEDMSISGLIPLRKRFSLMHTAAGAAKETSIRQRDASSKSMEGSSSVMSTPSQDSKVGSALTEIGYEEVMGVHQWLLLLAERRRSLVRAKTSS